MTTLARQSTTSSSASASRRETRSQKAAERFPNSHFAIIDVDQASLPGKPKNVVGLLFKEQEVGYLAGFLAALEAQRQGGKDVVGSVGGFKEPRSTASSPATRPERAGRPRRPTPERLLAGLGRPREVKELALDQIARGAKVVFQVAGGCGLGALDAAKERRVWGIGVDADQSFLGPHVLTSALKRVDAAVFQTIETVRDGKFRGGRNLVFGLDRDGVGLGRVSPKVPEADWRSWRR